MSKKKVAAEVDHVVTEETLKLNPDLKEQGVTVGETISYPAEPEQGQTFECALCEREKSEECRTIGRPNVCQSCTIEELNTRNEIQKQEIASLNEQLTQQDQETEDLRIQLKEAQELAADAMAVYNAAAVKVSDTLETEVKGKKVKINHGVDFDGKRYTAKDLVENTEVLEQLLEIGSGSITLID